MFMYSIHVLTCLHSTHLHMLMAVSDPVKQFPGYLLTEAILCTIQDEDLLARLFVAGSVSVPGVMGHLLLIITCSTQNTRYIIYTYGLQTLVQYMYPFLDQAHSQGGGGGD